MTRCERQAFSDMRFIIGKYENNNAVLGDFYLPLFMRLFPKTKFCAPCYRFAV